MDHLSRREHKIQEQLSSKGFENLEEIGRKATGRRKKIKVLAQSLLSSISGGTFSEKDTYEKKAINVLNKIYQATKQDALTSTSEEGILKVFANIHDAIEPKCNEPSSNIQTKERKKAEKLLKELDQLTEAHELLENYDTSPLRFITIEELKTKDNLKKFIYSTSPEQIAFLLETNTSLTALQKKGVHEDDLRFALHVSVSSKLSIEDAFIVLKNIELESNIERFKKARALVENYDTTPLRFIGLEELKNKDDLEHFICTTSLKEMDLLLNLHERLEALQENGASENDLKLAFNVSVPSELSIEKALILIKHFETTTEYGKKDPIVQLVTSFQKLPEENKEYIVKKAAQYTYQEKQSLLAFTLIACDDVKTIFDNRENQPGFSLPEFSEKALLAIDWIEEKNKDLRRPDVDAFIKFLASPESTDTIDLKKKFSEKMLEECKKEIDLTINEELKSKIDVLQHTGINYFKNTKEYQEIELYRSGSLLVQECIDPNASESSLSFLEKKERITALKEAVDRYTPEIQTEFTAFLRLKGLPDLPKKEDIQLFTEEFNINAYESLQKELGLLHEPIQKVLEFEQTNEHPKMRQDLKEHYFLIEEKVTINRYAEDHELVTIQELKTYIEQEKVVTSLLKELFPKEHLTLTSKEITTFYECIEEFSTYGLQEEFKTFLKSKDSSVFSNSIQTIFEEFNIKAYENLQKSLKTLPESVQEILQFEQTNNTHPKMREDLEIHYTLIENKEIINRYAEEHEINTIQELKTYIEQEKVFTSLLQELSPEEYLYILQELTSKEIIELYEKKTSYKHEDDFKDFISRRLQARKKCLSFLEEFRPEDHLNISKTLTFKESVALYELKEMYAQHELEDIFKVILSDLFDTGENPIATLKEILPFALALEKEKSLSLEVHDKKALIEICREKMYAIESLEAFLTLASTIQNRTDSISISQDDFNAAFKAALSTNDLDLAIKSLKTFYNLQKIEHLYPQESTIVEYFNKTDPDVLSGIILIEESPSFTALEESPLKVCIPIILEKTAPTYVTEEMALHLSSNGNNFKEFIENIEKAHLLYEKFHTLSMAEEALSVLSDEKNQFYRTQREKFSNAIENPYIIDAIKNGTTPEIILENIESMYTYFSEFPLEHDFEAIMYKGLKEFLSKKPLEKAFLKATIDVDKKALSEQMLATWIEGFSKNQHPFLTGLLSTLISQPEEFFQDEQMQKLFLWAIDVETTSAISIYISNLIDQNTSKKTILERLKTLHSYQEELKQNNGFSENDIAKGMGVLLRNKQLTSILDNTTEEFFTKKIHTALFRYTYGAYIGSLQETHPEIAPVFELITTNQEFFFNIISEESTHDFLQWLLLTKPTVDFLKNTPLPATTHTLEAIAHFYQYQNEMKKSTGFSSEEIAYGLSQLLKKKNTLATIMNGLGTSVSFFENPTQTTIFINTLTKHLEVLKKNEQHKSLIEYLEKQLLQDKVAFVKDKQGHIKEYFEWLLCLNDSPLILDKIKEVNNDVARELVTKTLFSYAKDLHEKSPYSYPIIARAMAKLIKQQGIHVGEQLGSSISMFSLEDEEKLLFQYCLTENMKELASTQEEKKLIERLLQSVQNTNMLPQGPTSHSILKEICQQALDMHRVGIDDKEIFHHVHTHTGTIDLKNPPTKEIVALLTKETIARIQKTKEQEDTQQIINSFLTRCKEDPSSILSDFLIGFSSYFAQDKTAVEESIRSGFESISNDVNEYPRLKNMWTTTMGGNILLGLPVLLETLITEGEIPLVDHVLRTIEKKILNKSTKTSPLLDATITAVQGQIDHTQDVATRKIDIAIQDYVIPAQSMSTKKDTAITAMRNCILLSRNSNPTHSSNIVEATDMPLHEFLKEHPDIEKKYSFSKTIRSIPISLVVIEDTTQEAIFDALKAQLEDKGIVLEPKGRKLHFSEKEPKAKKTFPQIFNTRKKSIEESQKDRITISIPFHFTQNELNIPENTTCKQIGQHIVFTGKLEDANDILDQITELSQKIEQWDYPLENLSSEENLPKIKATFYGVSLQDTNVQKEVQNQQKAILGHADSSLEDIGTSVIYCGTLSCEELAKIYPSKDAQITALPETNTLIITDRSDQRKIFLEMKKTQEKLQPLEPLFGKIYTVIEKLDKKGSLQRITSYEKLILKGIKWLESYFNEDSMKGKTIRAALNIASRITKGKTSQSVLKSIIRKKLVTVLKDEEEAKQLTDIIFRNIPKLLPIARKLLPVLFKELKKGQNIDLIMTTVQKVLDPKSAPEEIQKELHTLLNQIGHLFIGEEEKLPEAITSYAKLLSNAIAWLESKSKEDSVEGNDFRTVLDIASRLGKDSLEKKLLKIVGNEEETKQLITIIFKNIPKLLPVIQKGLTFLKEGKKEDTIRFLIKATKKILDPKSSPEEIKKELYTVISHLFMGGKEKPSEVIASYEKWALKGITLLELYFKEDSPEGKDLRTVVDIVCRIATGKKSQEIIQGSIKKMLLPVLKSDEEAEQLAATIFKSIPIFLPIIRQLIPVLLKEGEKGHNIDLFVATIKKVLDPKTSPEEVKEELYALFGQIVHEVRTVELQAIQNGITNAIGVASKEEAVKKEPVSLQINKVQQKVQGSPGAIFSEFITSTIGRFAKIREEIENVKEVKKNLQKIEEKINTNSQVQKVLRKHLPQELFIGCTILLEASLENNGKIAILSDILKVLERKLNQYIQITEEKPLEPTNQLERYVAYSAELFFHQGKKQPLPKEEYFVQLGGITFYTKPNAAINQAIEEELPNIPEEKEATVFDCGTLSQERLKETYKKLLSSDGKIVLIPNTNALLVIDNAENVEKIVQQKNDLEKLNALIGKAITSLPVVIDKIDSHLDNKLPSQRIEELLVWFERGIGIFDSMLKEGTLASGVMSFAAVFTGKTKEEIIKEKIAQYVVDPLGLPEKESKELINLLFDSLPAILPLAKILVPVLLKRGHDIDEYLRILRELSSVVSGKQVLSEQEVQKLLLSLMKQVLIEVKGEELEALQQGIFAVAQYIQKSNI